MRYEEPSWRLPYTKYGARVSTYTWYIWAIGSTMRMNVLPRLSVMLAPPSCATMKRSGFSGSIQMSWLSPPPS